MSLDFRRLRRAFRLPSSVKHLDAGIDEEFAFHLAMREQRLREQGLDPADAERVARDRFGPLPSLRADCIAQERRQLERNSRMTAWHDFRHDLRYAWRDVRRARGFAVATLLTLALGIGVTTAAYSVVRGALLRPLPYPNADRLVLVAGRYGTSGGGASMSTPTVNDLVDGTKTFTALGASIANETT
ncbi:MAG: permease prefix domain 1-containing protein, partial [Gemmatimonadales bacterium]